MNQEITSNHSERVPSWRIPEIDGLRALAIFMVLLCHAYLFIGEPNVPIHFMGYQMNIMMLFGNGSKGVEFFYGSQWFLSLFSALQKSGFSGALGRYHFLSKKSKAHCAALLHGDSLFHRFSRFFSYCLSFIGFPRQMSEKFDSFSDFSRRAFRFYKL